jgi:hypothetical protein
MRRLTTKDIANRKMDNAAVPDFYSLSREYPLPEATDGMPDEGDHPLSSSVAAAASSSAQTLHRTSDQSSVTATCTAQAGSRKTPAIPRNIQMQAERRMLEKRRKEIVDRIAFLAANLGQATTSENNDSGPATATAAYSRGSRLDANGFGGGGDSGGGGHLGNPPATGASAASTQPSGDGVGSLSQQGILALLHQPGGAQLLAQLALGIQINRQNNTESQARIAAPSPPAFNQNLLLSIPGGFQLFQNLMSSSKSNQTSLQVNAPVPVAYTPPAPAPAMGEAQLIVERLMQAINNRTTTDSVTMAHTPTLVSSSAQITGPVQTPHLAPPTAVAPPPPPMAGLPAAILQMLSAAQQHQAPPPTTMHASMSNMPQADSSGYGASAILQMLTAAMSNSNASAATPSAPLPPPPPPQPLFAPSASTGQSTNDLSNQNSSQQQHPDAAAMMQQLLQNGNLDLASLMSMSHASLNHHR